MASKRVRRMENLELAVRENSMSVYGANKHGELFRIRISESGMSIISHNDVGERTTRTVKTVKGLIEMLNSIDYDYDSNKIEDGE